MIRLLPFLLLLLSATLAGCSQGVDNERVRVDVIEDRPKPFNVSATPLPLASAYLRSATAQGLVTFDEKGRVAPGLASRWIVNDDGMSYIFRLNKARWNDGRELDSQEVAQLLTRRISELKKGRLGSELAVIDRVVAMTGKVVEIRLKAPMPYLLELLALPEFGLLRRGAGSGGPWQSLSRQKRCRERQILRWHSSGAPCAENSFPTRVGAPLLPHTTAQPSGAGSQARR
jgi:ABC-type oligopeptide transport system substrate-binding subunit